MVLPVGGHGVTIVYVGGAEERLLRSASLGDANRFPRPRRLVLRGRRIPGGGAWRSCAHTSDIASTPLLKQCLGPIVAGFEPSSQPMGRAGDDSQRRVLLWCAVGGLPCLWIEQPL